MDTAGGEEVRHATPDTTGEAGLHGRLQTLGGDLKDPRWIYAKGLLFLFTGSLAAMILLLENPSWRVVILLSLTIWCFCRSYYFAFYVIEHYVDSSYKFAGLWSFMRYLMRRK